MNQQACYVVGLGLQKTPRSIVFSLQRWRMKRKTKCIAGERLVGRRCRVSIPREHKGLLWRAPPPLLSGLGRGESERKRLCPRVKPRAQTLVLLYVCSFLLLCSFNRIQEFVKKIIKVYKCIVTSWCFLFTRWLLFWWFKRKCSQKYHIISLFYKGKWFNISLQKILKQFNTFFLQTNIYLFSTTTIANKLQNSEVILFA